MDTYASGAQEPPAAPEGSSSLGEEGRIPITPEVLSQPTAAKDLTVAASPEVGSLLITRPPEPHETINQPIASQPMTPEASGLGVTRPEKVEPPLPKIDELSHLLEAERRLTPSSLGASLENIPMGTV